MENSGLYKERLCDISPISEDTWSSLKEMAEVRHMDKNTLLIGAGSIVNKEVFVVHGLLRCYVLTTEGKEYTTAFYREGTFVAPYFSRSVHGSSTVSIEVLETSELLLFPEQDFTKLRHANKDLERLAGVVVQQELQHKSTKELKLATGNLRELYAYFQYAYKGMERRVQQKHIASYLGVDPVSLSRIRKSNHKKESPR